MRLAFCDGGTRLVRDGRNAALHSRLQCDEICARGGRLNSTDAGYGLINCPTD